MCLGNWAHFLFKPNLKIEIKIKKMRIKSTLVWSSENHDRTGILVLDNTTSYSSLMDRIFVHTGKQSKRLTITEHKYFYAPSEQYKKHIIRFKKTK
jgi:hypothetical protein